MLSKLVYFSIGCIVSAGAAVLLHKRKINLQVYKKLLFFTPIEHSCRRSLYLKSANCCDKECGNKNLRIILQTLGSAKKTLDICVYLITCNEVYNVILKLFKSGVYVRIITDKAVGEDACNSKMNFFYKERIPVKVYQSVHMMHNKFAIIDKTVVLFGSFNWTVQAFYGNYESGMITNEAEIVEAFDIYFQSMWNDELSPIV